MADNEKLSAVLNNLVQNKTEQAQLDFHDYLQQRLKDMMGKTTEVEHENTKE